MPKTFISVEILEPAISSSRERQERFPTKCVSFVPVRVGTLFVVEYVDTLLFVVDVGALL